MGAISRRHILRQLRADLIGKDSYRGVTLTYSWLANQFGHFSLGFIPALIAYVALKDYTSLKDPEFFSALFVSLIWLAFEIVNFLVPLLRKPKINPQGRFLKGQKYVFPPRWTNIGFDTFTDLCFFWIGAFSASLFIEFSWLVVIILIGLFLIVIYPVYYWYITKMYLQAAQYLFQFRLSQWDAAIDAKDKEEVISFLNNRERGNHLLVFGSNGTGKTSISVGMATELSIKHQTCLYTTAIKLFSMFYEEDEKILNDKKYLWTWRNCSHLVIDDVSPGNASRYKLMGPSEFLKNIDTFTPRNEENRDTIRNKNVIWVLGEDPEKRLFREWQGMLREIGVDEEKIHSIYLP